MRQYRGLTKDGKWVEGYCVFCRHENYILPIHNDSIGFDERWIQEGADDESGWFEVIPETVGQSIIVEDKEFYEGDVVKNDTGDIGVVQFGKLPLDKSGDCVCTYPAFYIHWFGQLGQAPTYECSEIGEWMEIIGTIHTTHPELLK